MIAMLTSVSRAERVVTFCDDQECHFFCHSNWTEVMARRKV
jgi:hypothetical protein